MVVLVLVLVIYVAAAGAEVLIIVAEVEVLIIVAEVEVLIIVVGVGVRVHIIDLVMMNIIVVTFLPHPITVIAHLRVTVHHHVDLIDMDDLHHEEFHLYLYVLEIHIDHGEGLLLAALWDPVKFVDLPLT